MFLLKNNRAFTLVEGIVVISILGIMAIVMIPGYRAYNKRNQLRESAQAVRSAIVEAQNIALAPKQTGGNWQYGLKNDYPDNKTFTVYETNGATTNILRTYTLPAPITWNGDSFRGQVYFTPPNAKPSCNGSTLITLRLDDANTTNVNLNCFTGQTVIDYSVCFAADSKVNVLEKNGTVVSKKIAEIVPGDFVESSDQNGQQTFSEVWSLVHDKEVRTANVINIKAKAENGITTSLSITPEHLLYVPSGNGNLLTKKSKNINVGDKVLIKNPEMRDPQNDPLTEATVTSVNYHQTRIINVLTMNDRIVVNGMLASVYTENEAFFTIVDSGPKALYKVFGSRIPNKIVNLSNKYAQKPVLEFIGKISSTLSVIDNKKLLSDSK